MTPEQIEKAKVCKALEEILALAKEEGVAITEEEAKVYLTELADMELDGETLAKVAGGKDHNVKDVMYAPHNL